MGRSPSITVGGATDGVRVEHLKGRGVVRLVRWTAGRIDDDGVGMEVSDFCARLGLTTDVLGPSRHYLRVPGAAAPGSDTPSPFRTKREARSAFVNMRRSDPRSDA